MTPPNKPEWMELADADSAPEVKKVTRTLPALVLAAALSIVGVGALVAQSGAETPAIASEQGVNTSVASASSEPSAARTIASAITPKQLGIAAMPTGNGDSDEDGSDDEENEGDDD